MMRIIESGSQMKQEVARAISQYGYAPEHHVDWFGYSIEPEHYAYFASWPDHTGLLIQHHADELYIFSEPLAPSEKGAQRILEFLAYGFEHFPVKKIWLELRENVRRDVLHALPESFRAHPINYTLTWPVMNLETFDASLPGKRWKSIRNARNAFYREHEVMIQDAIEIPKAPCTC
jgi:hypothetical protein